jgi:predicted Zn-ribbon and HTH transcriptional regulator
MESVVKSPYTAVELPTGFYIEGKGVVKSITIREMVGYDQDLLMNPKIKPVAKLNQIISNCIQSIGDIEDKFEIKKIARKMVGTDRALVLIEIRGISIGYDYEYTSKCPSCGFEDKKIYDIRQMKVINPPSAEELFYEVSLSDGRKARVRVADAVIDEIIESKSKEDNIQTIAIYSRISEIGDTPPTIDDIQRMKTKDINLLNKKRKEKEGYIDDVISVSCRNCSNQYQDNFVMEPVSFFGL